MYEVRKELAPLLAERCQVTMVAIVTSDILRLSYILKLRVNNYYFKDKHAIVQPEQ